MVKIVQILNPFDPYYSRDIQSVDVIKMGVVSDYSMFLKDVEDYELIYSLNGEVVEHPQKTYVLDGDCVVVSVIPEGGGGGKDILRTVAMIAVTAAAMWVTAGAAGFISTSMTFGSAMAGAAVAVGGAMLVNSVIPPQLPDQPSMSDYDSDWSSSSPTYGWDQSNNPTQQGIALPILYGRVKVVPPIISKYIKTVSDKQYLFVLYAISEGPIDEVANVRINDQPLSAFSNTIQEQYEVEVTKYRTEYYEDTICE